MNLAAATITQSFTTQTLRRPSPHAAEAVFGHLVAEHKDRLYRFVLRRIGDATEAEDITQQAFVEAALNYDAFRGEAQLSTWVYGIALNLVRNHLSRSPQRQYRFEDEEALAELPGQGPTPEQQITLDQHMSLLQRELNGLGPDMREVLMLVSVDELSYEDAAARLNLPVGTVRSRVSRARSQLRQRFLAAGMSPCVCH